MGSGAIANSTNRIGDTLAIGVEAKATGQDSLAIGDQVKATGVNSIAIGHNNGTEASGMGSIVVGTKANATALGGIAIGGGAAANWETSDGAKVTGAHGIALGTSSQATAENAIAIGPKAAASKLGAVALGFESNASGFQSTAIGLGALASNPSATALGSGSAGQGQASVAIGSSSKAVGSQAVAIGGGGGAGKGALAEGGQSIAIGGNVKAMGETSVAIGGDDLGGVAGYDDNVLSTPEAKKASMNTSAVAKAYKALTGDDLVTWNETKNNIFYNGTETGAAAVAIGTSTLAKGDMAIAVGTRADASGAFSAAFGLGAVASGEGATALGAVAKATAKNAMAQGTSSQATAENAIAIGAGSSATVAGGVALGQGSVANGYSTANITKHYTPTFASAADTAAIAATIKGINVGAVSVGSNEAGKEITRQITNLAAGTLNTDAVNVAQLKSVAENPLTFAADTGASVTRKLGQTLNIKGGKTADLSDNNIGVVASGTDTLTVKLAKELAGLTSVTTTDTDGNQTVTSGSGITITPASGNAVSLTTAGLNNGSNKIINVAAGTAATDAANIGQLTPLATAINATFNPSTGAITAPNYTVGSVSGYTTVQDALTALSGHLTTAKMRFYSVNTSSPAGRGNYNNDGAQGLHALAAGVDTAAKGQNSTVVGSASSLDASSQSSSALGSGNTGTAAANALLLGNNNRITDSSAVSTIGGLNVAAGAVAASLTGIGNTVTNASGSSITGVGNTVAQASGLTLTEQAAFATLMGNIRTNPSYSLTGADKALVDKLSSNNVLGSLNTLTNSSQNNVFGNLNTLTTGTQNLVAGFNNTLGANLQGNQILGSNATVAANVQDGVLIGRGASLQANNAVAIGKDANAIVAGSVALGQGSVAARSSTAGSTEGYAPAAATSADKAAIAATIVGSNVGAVSVGSTTATRQITNVAAGSENSDAVNVAQLKSIAENPLTFAADTGTSVTRKLGDTLNIKGGASDVSNENNIGIAANNVTGTLAVKLAKELKGLTSVTTGNTKIDNAGLTITSGPSVTSTGIDAASKKITNVAAGDVGATSKDAINGSQLYGTANSIAGVLGGDAAVDASGKLGMSNIGGTGQNTVDEAINAVMQTAAGKIAFKGDNTTATDVQVGLTESLTIKGGADSSNLSDSNIGVEADAATGALNIKLAKDLTGLTSVAAGTFSTGAGGPSISSTGIDAGNKQIINVASAGSISDPDNKLKAVNAGDVDAALTGIKATGFKVSDTNGDADTIQLGETLNIAGSDANITTKVTNNKVTIALASDLVVTSVKAGDNVLDSTVMTVNGTSIANVGAAINALDTQVTRANSGWNLQANGDTSVAVKPTETVNFKDGKHISITRASQEMTVAAVGIPIEYVDQDGNVIYQQADGTTYKDVNGAVVNPTAVNTKLIGKDTITSPVLGNVGGGKIASNSTDAINGAQLHATNQAVSDALGNDALNADGTIKAPSYTVSGNTYTSVAGALGAINGSLVHYYSVNDGGVHSGGNYANDGAKAANSIAAGVGASATVSAISGLAFGHNASVTVANGVALGSGSVADRDVGVTGMYTSNPLDATNSLGAVSVGTATHVRQIINVGDGSSDTDAVNVRQLTKALRTVATSVTVNTQNNSPFAFIDNAGGAVVKHTDGKFYTPLPSGYPDMDKPVAAENIRISTIASDEHGTTGSAMQIKNVANAVDNTDAVNLQQLNAKAQALTDAGLQFKGNNTGSTVTTKLGSALGIIGATSTDAGTTLALSSADPTKGSYSSANLQTFADATTGRIQVQMADSPVFAGKVTADSIDVGSINSIKIESKTVAGNTTNTISNLTAVPLTQNSNNAATVGQVWEVKNSLNNATFGLKAQTGDAVTNTLGNTVQVVGGADNATAASAKNVKTVVDKTDLANPKLQVQIVDAPTFDGKVTGKGFDASGGTAGATNAITNVASMDADQLANATNKYNAVNAETLNNSMTALKDAGWKLQTNTGAEQTVKLGDTVQVVNGNNTKVSAITSVSGKHTYQIDVAGLPIAYTTAAGVPVVKVGDNYYEVDANGKADTNKQATASALKTKLLNPAAAANTVGSATILGNVAAGSLVAGSTDAVNGGQINTFGNAVASALGGTSAFDAATGKVTPGLKLDNAAGSTSYDSVEKAMQALNAAATGAQSTANKGLKFAANSGTDYTAALGSTVSVKGDAANTVASQFDAGKNIMTSVDSSGNILVALAKDLEASSIKLGNGTNTVTVDGAGTITGLANTTWNGTATSGRAATEDQLKAVDDAAKATAGAAVQYDTAGGTVNNNSVTLKGTPSAAITNADGTFTMAGGTALKNVASAGSINDPDNAYHAVNAGDLHNYGTALSNTLNTNLTNKGLVFAGNNRVAADGANDITVKLGDALKIYGAAGTGTLNALSTATATTGSYSAANIQTITDKATGAIQIQMAEKPVFTSITTGSVTGLANTTLAGSDFGTKGRAATEEQLKLVQAEVAASKTTVKAGSSGNVTVTPPTPGATEYTVDLANDLNLTSVTTGNTKIDNTGVTIEQGTKITKNKIVVGDDQGTTAITINGSTGIISNVTAGVADKDAVNKKQLDTAIAGVTTNVTTVTNNVSNISNVLAGDPAAVNPLIKTDGSLTDAGKQALKTYNTSGQETTENTTIINAIQNINEGGIKYFHSNGANKGKNKTGNTDDSSASGSYATAIGHQAEASGTNSIAFGNGATASGINSISIGTGNTVRGNNSGAIGDPSIIDGANSYSVGNNNTVAAGSDNVFVLGNNVNVAAGNTNAVVLGNAASVTRAGGVALGAGSVAGAAHVGIYTLGGYNDANVAGRTSATTQVVSVGSAGHERQIQNVAAGEVSATSTDAINGSQLYHTNQAVAELQRNGSGGVSLPQFNAAVDTLAKDANAGAASAMATAGLPQAYLPGKSMIAVAGSVYRNATAQAIGVSTITENGKWVFKGSVNLNNRGNAGATVGVGYQW